MERGGIDRTYASLCRQCGRLKEWPSVAGNSTSECYLGIDHGALPPVHLHQWFLEYLDSLGLLGLLLGSASLVDVRTRVSMKLPE